MDKGPGLRTPRLHLRLWRDDDAELFAALHADPRVMEFYPKLLTRDESDKTLEYLRVHFDRHGFGMWAVEVRGGAAFIGFVGLNIPRFEAAFTPCVEVGWRLAFEHWGHGYATEGARAALGHGFEAVGLNEILAWTAVRNARSRRVMDKLGMTRNPADDFEHPSIPEGHPVRRHVMYRMSRQLWNQNPGPERQGQ